MIPWPMQTIWQLIFLGKDPGFPGCRLSKASEGIDRAAITIWKPSMERDNSRKRGYEVCISLEIRHSPAAWLAGGWHENGVGSSPFFVGRIPDSCARSSARRQPGGLNFEMLTSARARRLSDRAGSRPGPRFREKTSAPGPAPAGPCTSRSARPPSLSGPGPGCGR